eukprot:m.53851 g.53851  ORF g.53851 m.53851 type:complete len:445 (-) comp13202_c0_seq1:233-1567(-)
MRPAVLFVVVVAVAAALLVLPSPAAAKKAASKVDDSNVDPEEFADMAEVESTAAPTTEPTQAPPAAAGKAKEKEADEESEEEGAEETKSESTSTGADSTEKPTLKHARGSGSRNWYWEMLALAGLFSYLMNYISGRNKNNRIATAWMRAILPTLEENFSHIGTREGQMLVQESASEYLVHNTGRRFCYSLAAMLNLVGRHDLINVMSNLNNRAKDTMQLFVHMDETSMDSFVLAVVPKTQEKRIKKEFEELSFFTQPANGESYGLTNHFVVMTDSREAAEAVLTPEVKQVLDKYKNDIDCIVMSDQFGAKADQSAATDAAAAAGLRKVLLFRFLTPNLEEDSSPAVVFLKMALNMVDAVGRTVLPPSSKTRAKTKREEYGARSSKQTTHQARMQRAQEAKEAKMIAEKRRAEQMSDEAYAKWEEKQQKKNLRKKMSKATMVMKM